MNWLRYVLLAVCILSALAGYRKGLVRTVLSMVSLILVTGLAIWMNPCVTDVLNERTTLPQYVEKKCLETFENNEFLSGENQDVQKKWLESMGVPEELVNQILGSGAVREYQEEQLHSLASYAAKAVSEKIMKGIAFFLTLVLAVGFVTIAVKIVELIAEIPGQAAHPEKRGDMNSKNFQKDWMASCDEAEKEMVYQSAYKAYMALGKMIQILLCATMILHLVFHTGILAVIVVGVIYLTMTLTYHRSCVSLQKAKLNL